MTLFIRHFRIWVLALGFFLAAIPALLAQDASANPGGDVIGGFDALTAPFKQVLNSPASLLVIPGLSIVAWLIEIAPFINSKFIPHVCVGLGGAFYWMFTSAASVPKSFPHPSAVLVMNGIICGFLAFVVHKQLICRFFLKPNNTGSNPN